MVSNTLPVSEREAAVTRMIARQRHRGPDDSGIVSNGDATIGMCRLAVIDPENGHQPMTSPDGRFHLVFNGAIYNYRELKKELTGYGWQFRTDCDTEVLLALLSREGAAGLHRLRGMFAFMLWDCAERRLLAARDALGIKPLYYARLSGRGLLVASEINALFASRHYDRAIDPAGVGDYLAWFSVPAPRTIYRGVACLPPGHLLTVDASGRLETHSWWHLPANRGDTGDTRQSYADFVAELRHRLEDTIRAHQVADVPVGAFLSGGIDSGAVVGLMSATGATRLHTYSLTFGESEFSEATAAAAVADKFGTTHHAERITGARVASDLPKIVAALDQPTGDGINTYYASQIARNGGMVVALSGLGGDELFGGYPSFRDLPRLAAALPFWRLLAAGLRARIVTSLDNRGTTRPRKLADFLAHGRDIHELASLQRRVLPETTRLSLLAPDARRHAARLGPLHPHLDDIVAELAGADTFQIISAWELKTYMTDVLLRDSDVFSMAHSLELRVPFVDRVLLEWLWNQPTAFKHQSHRPKQALRDAVADLIPIDNRHRPKRGFTLPFPVWMRNELREFLDETFSVASLQSCPWLEPQTAQHLWETFRSGTDSRAWSRVWTVAMLIAFANRPASE